MVWAKVDLPAPFGPTTAWICPSQKSIDSSNSICCSSKERETFFNSIIPIIVPHEIFFLPAVRSNSAVQSYPPEHSMPAAPHEVFRGPRILPTEDPLVFQFLQTSPIPLQDLIQFPHSQKSTTHPAFASLYILHTQGTYKN